MHPFKGENSGFLHIYVYLCARALVRSCFGGGGGTLSKYDKNLVNQNLNSLRCSMYTARVQNRLSNQILLAIHTPDPLLLAMKLARHICLTSSQGSQLSLIHI